MRALTVYARGFDRENFYMALILQHEYVFMCHTSLGYNIIL